MNLTIGTKLGAYEIIAPLGAGGMGEVYRARDTRLGRDVALKVLPEAFARDAERLRRFEQEAKAASALNHPNVLAVYDIGTDGAPYLVTELLEGETLRERLRNDPLPVRKALDIAMQVAYGVAAAHEKGIIHRDLKPANIFLTSDGRVKILDFGLAKLTQQDNASRIGETQSPTRTSGPAQSKDQAEARTEAGVVLGTAGYMSPEQVRGKPADARSDIFALGAILYEMLSGRRAFEKDSSADTMAAILKEEPPELSGEGKKIPPAVERVVQHCLEKNPAERFQSARDFAFNLAALSDASTSSKAVLPAASASNACGKRRLLFAAAGTAGLIVVGIVAYFAGRGATGSQPIYKQITFSRGTIFQARFAPDGQSVYYSAAWEGQPAALYATDPHSPESRPLGLANSSLFAVSASQLAISIGCNHVFIGVCEGTLATVPISGGAPRQIADDVFSADWSPDGSQMAAIREANGKFQIEFPLGKVIYESQTWLNFLRVSARGDAVAFAQYSTDNADIGRVIILDKNGKQIARSEEYVSVEGIAWEPQGDRILYAASKTAGWADSIHALTVNGKDRTVLTLPGVLRVHDISKDGRVLLSQDQWRNQMQYRGAKDAEERELSWLDGTTVSDLSENGQELAFDEFMEAAGPLPIAYMRKANEQSAVKLGIGLNPVLSPDGKWALVGGYNPLHLALLPTGIGQGRSLETYGLQQFEWQGWMPGGSSVYFAGNDGHSWRVYVQDLAGGAPRAITPPIDVNGYQVPSGLVSPDGKFVFARDLTGRSNLYPVAGGQPLPVPGLLPEDTWAGWATDGKSIYLYQDKVTQFDVFRLELATGKRQLVRTLAPRDNAGLSGIDTFRITPDGKSYAYSYDRALSTLYLVDGVK